MIQKPFRGVQLNRTHPLAKGLVGCWLFNEATGETAFDLSGHGNNGTLENDVAWGGSKFGGSLKFDGVDDYVDCGNDSSLDVTTAFTVSVWVKPNTGYGSLNNPGVISKRVESWGGIWVSSSTGKLWGRIYQSDSVIVNLPQNVVLPINQWSFIVLVANPSDNYVRQYINAIEIGSVYYNGTIRTGSDNLLIGEQTSEFFNGSIDSVRIYNRALSAEEVAWSYREPYAMFEPSFNPAIYGAVFTKREILNLTSTIDKTLATTSTIDKTLATTSTIDKTLALSSKMDIEAAA